MKELVHILYKIKKSIDIYSYLKNKHYNKYKRQRDKNNNNNYRIF